jgi:hypothetical protein
MHDAFTLYFNGEKFAGLFIAGVGVMALVAAALLFRGMRAFSVAMIVLGLIEIALGVGLYLRTGPQVRRLEAMLAADEAGFRVVENARLTRVQRNFAYIEIAEVAIIIVSALVAVALKNRPAVSGVALALLIHAGVLLAFDLVAERRGKAYWSALRVPFTGI